MVTAFYLEIQYFYDPSYDFDDEHSRLYKLATVLWVFFVMIWNVWVGILCFKVWEFVLCRSRYCRSRGSILRGNMCAGILLLQLLRREA